MAHQYRDRAEAGEMLARTLGHYANQPGVLVLALPRGGVPVAYPVALALNAPLDVFIVRKLGVPGHEELAMGAIATGRVRVLNEDLIKRLGISAKAVDLATISEKAELERREALFRGDNPPPDIADQTVILVDDGLATGSTMRAAVQALRKQNPARIVVAVPIGAPETCDEFRAEADEVICAQTPEPFFAVGMWYCDFAQTTDREVHELLEEAGRRYANPQAVEQHAPSH